MGDEIQLILNASDSDGDTLSFKATGLPDGLNIDNESGIISGIISSITSLMSSHIVKITVADSQGENNAITFKWVINGANVVAQYSKGFESPPEMGWSYHWNPDAAIGQSNAYIDMQRTFWKYDSDGVAGLPDDSSLAWGNFDHRGGHPGKGTLQGEINDRYVIAGFTVDNTGDYQIKESLIKNNSCLFGNGLTVEVYVDDNLIDKNILDVSEVISFDVDIGVVEAGSTIYVAV